MLITRKQWHVQHSHQQTLQTFDETNRGYQDENLTTRNQQQIQGALGGGGYLCSPPTHPPLRLAPPLLGNPGSATDPQSSLASHPDEKLENLCRQ